MALIDLRTARVLFTALLFALALGFLYVAHQTLMAFLFAVFFAYLVDPAVSRLERWTRSRGSAIAVIYLLLLALVVTFFFFVGPKIAHQGQRLRAALPSLLERVGSGQIAQDIGKDHGWSLDTREQLQTFLASHRETLLGIAQRAGLRLAEAAQESWLLVLTPILAAFFLRDGRSFSEVLLSLVQARPQREFLEGVLSDLNQMLAHFIRAQLTLAAFSLVVYTAFMAAMGVPYALVLGTAGGMLEFIPVVGPLVAAVLIVGVCLLLSYSHWLLLLGFLAFWRGVQDYLVSASARSHLRRAGGRRDRGRSRRLSFHSGDGQPAHRLAPLASLCGEAAIWPAQRIFVWDRDHTAEVVQISSARDSAFAEELRLGPRQRPKPPLL